MERKTRSDKKIRVGPSLDQDTHDKLVLLSLSCSKITKTKLAELILVIALNDPRSVINLQDQFGPVNNPYRILPINNGGKAVYKTKFE